ncbi:MAG: hypothetical protein HY376_01925 [Candidatus Blackburnbacteria bacterium]|nr:hypothetical protein [Candidatus Blackburnbacteria bacterium]
MAKTRPQTESLLVYDFVVFHKEHIKANPSGRDRVFELEDFISNARDRIRKVEVVQSSRRTPSMFVGEDWAREARNVPQSDLVWVKEQMDRAQKQLITELNDPASDGLIDRERKKPTIRRSKFKRDEMAEQLASLKTKGRKDYRGLAREMLEKQRR